MRQASSNQAKYGCERVEMTSDTRTTFVIFWNLQRVKVEKGLETWSDYFLQQTELLMVQRMKQTTRDD